MNIRNWLRSFRFAYDGLLYALATQKNMKFHFLAAFAVLILALFLELTKIEILFIMLAVTLIIITELINTAVEKAVDLAMPEQHPVAKIAKDVAAASVLVTAAFAVSVGIIVFYEPMDEWLRGLRHQHQPLEIGPIWIIATIVLLSTMVLHTRFSTRRIWLRPSLISALAFSISTMIAIQSDTLITILAYSLSGIMAIILYEKTKRSFFSLCMGALLGSLITFGIFIVLM